MRSRHHTERQDRHRRFPVFRESLNADRPEDGSCLCTVFVHLNDRCGQRMYEHVSFQGINDRLHAEGDLPFPVKRGMIHCLQFLPGLADMLIIMEDCSSSPQILHFPYSDQSGYGLFRFQEFFFRQQIDIFHCHFHVIHLVLSFRSIQYRSFSSHVSYGKGAAGMP